MARVTFTEEAWNQALELPKVIRARIDKLADRLENWPKVSGAKPLRNSLAGQFRLRTGDYRLQFRIEGDEVVDVQVGHRDGFYEE